jgi:hypothetical protein
MKAKKNELIASVQESQMNIKVDTRVYFSVGRLSMM